MSWVAPRGGGYRATRDDPPPAKVPPGRGSPSGAEGVAKWEAEVMYHLRKFDGGATRDTDAGKYDYEGYLSPAVLREFGCYMHKHQTLPDGSTRGSDNWQAGMPKDVYMKSLVRHVFDLWLIHRGEDAARPENGEVVTVDDALGGILFNLQGYWLQHTRGTE